MNTDIIQSLTTTFEAHAQQTETGVEYWLARDIQHLLGYAEWRNFNQSAVSKAKTACEVSGHHVSDHFVDANKMVDLGSGGTVAIQIRNLPRHSETKPGGQERVTDTARLARLNLAVHGLSGDIKQGNTYYED